MPNGKIDRLRALVVGNEDLSEPRIVENLPPAEGDVLQDQALANPPRPLEAPALPFHSLAAEQRLDGRYGVLDRPGFLQQLGKFNRSRLGDNRLHTAGIFRPAAGAFELLHVGRRSQQRDKVAPRGVSPNANVVWIQMQLL